MCRLGLVACCLYYVEISLLYSKGKRQIGQLKKEEVKVPLFTDDVSLYMKDPKTLPKTSADDEYNL